MAPRRLFFLLSNTSWSQVKTAFSKGNCQNLIFHAKCSHSSQAVHPVHTDWLSKQSTLSPLQRIFRSYENFVGLTDVKEAQAKVVQAESEFSNSQKLRRESQQKLLGIQTDLRTVNAELDRVHRGEERYLTLLTQAHNIIKQENSISATLHNLEESERAKFSQLSATVRESHEKERSRSERVKYWSLIGSIIGAIVGVCGTSLGHYLRMKQFSEITFANNEESSELRTTLQTLSGKLSFQHSQLYKFLEDVKGLIAKEPITHSDTKPIEWQGNSAQMLKLLERQEVLLSAEMNDIKAMLASNQPVDSSNVVYVGPQVEQLLDDTEKNLEFRLKMSALWTASLVYVAFVLTLPVLYGIFKGS